MDKAFSLRAWLPPVPQLQLLPRPAPHFPSGDRGLLFLGKLSLSKEPRHPEPQARDSHASLILLPSGWGREESWGQRQRF